MNSTVWYTSESTLQKTILRSGTKCNWEEKNFTISLANEKDLHNLFGHHSSVSTYAGSLIFVEQRVFSFTSSNELYFSCVRSQWQRPDRTLASLAVRRKQKSKLGRSEYTRIPRLPMEFNICCLRYGTHDRAFFTLFHSSSLRPPPPLPSPPSFTIHSSRSFLNTIEVSAERRDLCLKYTIESDELEEQIELNSCVAYAPLLFGCVENLEFLFFDLRQSHLLVRKARIRANFTITFLC